MKYHHPSFFWEFQRRFDATFDVYDHHFIVYVVTANKYFTAELLIGILIEAITDALIAPQGTPDGPRQRSLFDAPPAPHLDALKIALQEHGGYLQTRTIQTGAGERIEWQIDCQQVQQVIAEVRKVEDAKLAQRLIAGDLFISNRLLAKKFYRYHGRALSEKRIRDIMLTLEMQGIIRGNGHLRTYGRDILQ
jgi:hypothetical protein